MHVAATALFLVAALVPACAWNPDKRTLADLGRVEPDMTEVRVEDSLDRAMQGYEKFLDEAAESALAPEAMRRLADLKLEEEYGLLGHGGGAMLPARGAGAESPSLATGLRRTTRDVAPGRAPSHESCESRKRSPWRRVAGRAWPRPRCRAPHPPRPGAVPIQPPAPPSSPMCSR